MPADVILMAVGDLLIDRDEPRSMFDGMRTVFRSADLLLGNQEGPASEHGEALQHEAKPGSRHLRSRPLAVAAEAEVGFSAVSLGNNHIMDYGPEAMLETISLLDQHGIGHAGAGADSDLAWAPWIVEREGVRLGMLSVTSVLPLGSAATAHRPGVAVIPIETLYRPPANVFYQPGSPPEIVTIPDAAAVERLSDAVRLLRASVDIVIVQCHWGVAQGYRQISAYMPLLARAAIDAGCDLVIGHHPPNLLGVEVYSGRVICYSLNHLAKDLAPRDDHWLRSVVLRVVIRDRSIHAVSLIPVRIDPVSLVPAPAEGATWETIAAEVEDGSMPFGTRIEPMDGQLIITTS